MAGHALNAGMLKEDKLGLGAAIVLHIALVAVLALQFAFATPRSVTPPRMSVSLATEVSLESTAPDPVEESRAAIAPTLSEEPAPEADPAQAEVEPVTTTPPPSTRTPRRSPARTTTPPRDRSRPDRTTTPPSAVPTRNSGGTRIGDNFLGGSGNSASTDETRLPASQIGRSAQASIIQAMSRQLSPHWVGKTPSGPDAELLETVVAFELNPDGSLKGAPRVVRQRGVNSLNESQKARHAEVALRAVRLAAPFDLPDEYYNAWKSIRGLTLNRNLGR